MDKNELVEAAGFLICTKQSPQQFLLMQHKSRWDLPKGRLDDGETLIEAALRETEEETGIPRCEIEVDRDFEFALEYIVESKKWGRRKKRSTYFLGYINKPTDIHLTEHVGFKWESWPPSMPIQAETIDPLIAAVRKHTGQ